MSYTPTDQGRFINVLRYWWNATPMAQLRLSTFESAISYYDKNPDFVSAMAWVAKTQDQSKVRAALEKLAAKSGHTYPKAAEFFTFMAQEIKTFNMTDARAVAVESAKDITKIATGALMIYAVAGAAALFLFFYRKRSQ